jgi:hypothetical protein
LIAPWLLYRPLSLIFYRLCNDDGFGNSLLLLHGWLGFLKTEL